MNSTTAQFFGKRPSPRVWRLCSMLAAVVCFVMLTTGLAQAGPVRINQVVQTLGSSRVMPELQLTLVSQDPAPTGTKSSNPSQVGPRNDVTQIVVASDPKLDSLLSGLTVMSDSQQIGVDIIEEGEVEGTVCDCGEILVAGAAFPKWPLLFLTAVPLVFINECDDCDENPQSTPTPTPPSTPTPNPSPVPEPASLLLFGTGLLAFGAGLRRHYARSKLAGQSQKTEEE